MHRLFRILRAVAIFFLVFAAVVFLLNTNGLAPRPSAKPLVVADRAP